MEPHPKQHCGRVRCGSIALLASLFAGLLTAFVHAATPVVTTPEYQLKAVFLFNFAQFVEWPEEAFEGASDPIVIGVLGPDPFGENLDAVMQGEQVNGRPIVVARYESAAQVDRCHLLFINQTLPRELERSLQELRGKPILTVGESSEFTHAGGIIRFLTENQRIRLQVNLRAADEAQLRLSSKLLRSSQIVAQAEN